MSESDAPSSADSAASSDDWSNWAMAGTDVQSVDQGMDLVSGNPDSRDWFPSIAATGVVTMALASAPEGDPLVSLASAQFAGNGAVGSDLESGLGDSAAQRAFAPPLAAAAATHVGASDMLSMPADYGMPLDHIEWHFTGLLPLT